MQVAYDHPLSINFLSFPLSSKKKTSLIAAQHEKIQCFPFKKQRMNKSRFYLRITGRTGRSSNRKRGLCHTPPPTVVTSIWLLITSWILSFARKHLDTVEAMWIDYLPDYLLLKTNSPGAKCLHSFYLEVVSRIRVKPTRSRRLINYLTLLIWVLLWSLVVQSFFKTRPKPTYNLLFSFTTWLVFHDIKNTTLRRKVTSFYFSSR